MKSPMDISGQVFGYLTVISIEDKPSNGYKNRRWICKCRCGSTTLRLYSGLRKHSLPSCGCARGSHGMSGTRLYAIYITMIARCHNPKAIDYAYYGAKNVSVCESWKIDFLNFHKWSIENGYSDDLTIDRKDPNGNYEPTNCKWATMREQNTNKRSGNLPTVLIKDEEKTLSEWAHLTGISYDVVRKRFDRGDRGESLLRPTRAKKSNATS